MRKFFMRFFFMIVSALWLSVLMCVMVAPLAIGMGPDKYHWLFWILIPVFFIVLGVAPSMQEWLTNWMVNDLNED